MEIFFDIPVIKVQVYLNVMKCKTQTTDKSVIGNWFDKKTKYAMVDFLAKQLIFVSA